MGCPWGAGIKTGGVCSCLGDVVQEKPGGWGERAAGLGSGTGYSGAGSWRPQTRFLGPFVMVLCPMKPIKAAPAGWGRRLGRDEGPGGAVMWVGDQSPGGCRHSLLASDIPVPVPYSQQRCRESRKLLLSLRWRWQCGGKVERLSLYGSCWDPGNGWSNTA